MKTTAVIIARFQTPFLHPGHQFLLNEIRRQYNKVVVVLGVSPLKSSKRNPFDFFTRERLLKQYDSKLLVLPLADHPSDETWSSQLDQLLQHTLPGESFRLFGSRDSFIPFYAGQLPCEELPLLENFSSTDIRESVSDQVMGSQDFRLGINYACQNAYAKVYPTVDIAVFGNNHSELLLGKKHHSNLWRLPGGFADPTDESLEAAAKRELSEECGAIETGTFQYIASVRIDDWRYRKEADKIITTLFSTEHLYGIPNAQDDLAEVKWFSIDQIQPMIESGQISREHVVLLERLNQHNKL